MLQHNWLSKSANQGPMLAILIPVALAKDQKRLCTWAISINYCLDAEQKIHK